MNEHADPMPELRDGLDFAVGFSGGDGRPGIWLEPERHPRIVQPQTPPPRRVRRSKRNNG